MTTIFVIYIGLLILLLIGLGLVAIYECLTDIRDNQRNEK